MAASSGSTQRAGTPACEAAEEKAALLQAPAQLLSPAAVRPALPPSPGLHGPSALHMREKPGIAFSSFVGTDCVSELLCGFLAFVRLELCWVSLLVHFL